MDENNELSEDISFDMSLLDDDFCTNDEEKKIPDVVNNDVSLLDTVWLNRPSIGSKNMDNFIHNLEIFGVNSSDSPNEPLSDTESECNSTMSSVVPSPAISESGNNHFEFNSINDNELVDLSVKDLNVKLKNYPKDSAKKYKKRRRTLKNRGYAHSCRQKRLSEKSTLQFSNKDLEKQMQVVTLENGRLRGMLAQYENLFRRISQQIDVEKLIKKA